MPAPPEVKRATLRRAHIPGATWVETGTFLGDTTEFLSAFARRVITIEPGPSLALAARDRFAGRTDISVIEGLSEDVLPTIVSELEGPVCFWLDGHWSSGVTYQGPRETPIREELSAIESHLDRLGVVTIAIDDVRCFDPAQSEFASYPTRSWLVEWADANDCAWTIEHDIFLARRELSQHED
jgi:hypothetical protein